MEYSVYICICVCMYVCVYVYVCVCCLCVRSLLDRISWKHVGGGNFLNNKGSFSTNTTIFIVVVIVYVHFRKHLFFAGKIYVLRSLFD